MTTDLFIEVLKWIGIALSINVILCFLLLVAWARFKDQERSRMGYGQVKQFKRKEKNS